MACITNENHLLTGLHIGEVFRIVPGPLPGLNNAGSLEPIISSDTSFWHNAWAKVLARNPGLGKLEVKHEVNKRNYGQGVRSIEDEERLDLFLQGIGVEPGTWRLGE
jgi:hypothetical protein